MSEELISLASLAFIVGQAFNQWNKCSGITITQIGLAKLKTKWGNRTGGPRLRAVALGFGFAKKILFHQ